MKKNKDKKNKIPDGVYRLSPAEMKILRDGHAKSELNRKGLGPYDNRDAAEALRFARKNKIITGTIIAFMFAFILVLIIMTVFFVSNYKNKPNTDNYVITYDRSINNTNKSVKQTVKYEDMMIDGVLYFDFGKLAGYCGFTTSGGGDKVKYTVSDNEYLSFFDGSSYATVSGDRVYLGDENIAYVKNGNCKVPFAFLKDAMTGITIKLDEKNNTIEISRNAINARKAIYEEISFSTDKLNVTEVLSVLYNIDIEDYIDYILPKKPRNYNFLVNRANPLASDFVPASLIELSTLGIAVGTQESSYYTLDETAAYALLAMLKSMETDGITGVYITSAYRSYARQQTLYNNYITQEMSGGLSRAEAEAKVMTYSAAPGTSEHQSGLCVDILQGNYQLNKNFANSDAFKWLSENAHKFGFILRYPEDKVDITTFDYEPWHYRFVGRDAATAIYNSGVCLEEYLK